MEKISIMQILHVKQLVKHNVVFNRRGLLKVKDGEGKEEEDKDEVDESLSRSSVQSLEGRELLLLAAFHEDSRRRLCGIGSLCSSNKDCDNFLGCLPLAPAKCQSYLGGTIGTHCQYDDDDCDFGELTCVGNRCVKDPNDGACATCGKCIANRCPNSAGYYGGDNMCWGGNYGDGCYEDYFGVDTCANRFECTGPVLDLAGGYGCGICK